LSHFTFLYFTFNVFAYVLEKVMTATSARMHVWCTALQGVTYIDIVPLERAKRGNRAMFPEQL